MSRRSLLAGFFLLVTSARAASDPAVIVNEAYQALCDAPNYSWEVARGRTPFPEPQARRSSPILTVHLPTPTPAPITARG